MVGKAGSRYGGSDPGAVRWTWEGGPGAQEGDEASTRGWRKPSQVVCHRGQLGTGSTETLGLSQFAGEGKQWEVSPGSGCSLVKVYPLGIWVSIEASQEASGEIRSQVLLQEASAKPRHDGRCSLHEAGVPADLGTRAAAAPTWQVQWTACLIPASLGRWWGAEVEGGKEVSNGGRGDGWWQLGFPGSRASVLGSTIHLLNSHLYLCLLMISGFQNIMPGLF